MEVSQPVLVTALPFKAYNLSGSGGHALVEFKEPVPDLYSPSSMPPSLIPTATCSQLKRTEEEPAAHLRGGVGDAGNPFCVRTPYHFPQSLGPQLTLTV
ncbi:hypothetical protein H0H92_005613 [Tricholoma furcatifolium]|nr:hypothetical protein H0H92_005613 [Tricholoma furcatifolium]